MAASLQWRRDALEASLGAGSPRLIAIKRLR
jgi:hypothetical protein